MASRRSPLAVIGAGLLLGGAAWADTYEITLQNSCPDATLYVTEVHWTMDGQANGSETLNPAWCIPPNQTQSRTFCPPSGTNDHGFSAVISFPLEDKDLVLHATASIGLDVDDLGVYFDAQAPSLFVGYDSDGPGAPQFCLSPMTQVAGQWVCSNPAAVDPVLMGSYSIRSIPAAVPALTPLALIVLLLLAGVAGALVLHRRALADGPSTA